MRLLLISLVTSLYAIAQQGILMSNYFDQKMLYNPAYAGVSDNLEVVSAYRSQWGGVQDNPKEYVLAISSPMGESNSSLGLNFNLDKLGPMSNYNLHGNYAYRFNFANEDFLQLGIRAGLDFGVINNTALDGYYKKDPNFTEENTYYNKTVFGAGIYYDNELFSIGLSIPDIIPGGYDFTNYKNSFQSVMKLYSTFDFKFIINENWNFKPGVQYRYNQASPMNFDVYTQWSYNNFLNLIAGYRSSGALLFGVQYEFNEMNFLDYPSKVKICYSYDVSNFKYMSQMGNAHEITLKVNFGVIQNRPVGYSRF